MIFKQGSPNSLTESYFTGDLGLGGVLNLESLNSPLHRSSFCLSKAKRLLNCPNSEKLLLP